MPLVEGRPLILYLTVLDNSMGYVLGQQDESGRKEHAIYYLSKKVYRLRDPILVARENLLRFGMGCSPAKTVYADPYYLIDI